MMSIAPIMPEEVRKITVDEFLHLSEIGFFHEDEKVELMEGILVPMSPQGAAHAKVIMSLNRWLSRVVGEEFSVLVQSSVRLNETSVVEPDVAVVVGDPENYGAKIPTQSDLRLVVEVAHSSLTKDSQRKMPLYAGAGVPEYWIVNIPGRRLEIHTEPRPDGYGVIHIVSELHEVAPLAFPNSPIEVVKLLPPKTD